MGILLLNCPAVQMLVDDGGEAQKDDDISACSDTDEVPKPPGKERKQAINHLETADDQTLRVSCADRLHNARSIDHDYAEMGADVWDKFSASREETLWYYASLAAISSRRLPDSPMSAELSRITSALTS